MIRLKPGTTGARIGGIRPEAVLGLLVAQSVYAEHGQDFVCTAALDSKHMAGSLHYVGLAFDLRPPQADLKARVIEDLREALADDFDVVEEGDHLHIEFQPKRGVNLAV